MENWKSLIESGKEIWEVPFKIEDNEEDNDTSEEEDEVVEDLPKSTNTNKTVTSRED